MSSSGLASAAATFDAGVASDVVVTTGNVANGVAAATIPAVGGKTAFLAGFSVTASGATAAAVVDVSVTGPTGTLHYSFTFPAGAAVAATPLVVEFVRPIPATAPNTAITVSCPPSGVGGTNCAVNAHGFYQ